jgi:hypothetical protein
VNAPGSAAAQVALVTAYAEYIGAAELHRTLGGVWLGVEADRTHADLLLAAMRCGFDPAGVHRHVSCLDWAGRRVRLIAKIMPNHVADAARRAA